MPAFIPVPNAASIETRFSLDGQRVEMVWYGDYTASNFANLVDAWTGSLDSWWTAIRGQFSTQLSLLEYYFTDLASQDGPVASISAGTAGNDVGGPVPNNVAFCVSLITAKRGKSARGRKYFPGIAAHLVSASRIDATAANVIVSGTQALIETVNAAGYPMVVVSRYHNNAPRAVGIMTQVLTARQSDLTVDSQRRRLPGRGL